MRTRADIDHAIHEEQALARVMHDAWNSDSIDMLSGVESPADTIDREMEERGHLLHAIEPSEEELDAARRHASAAVVSEIARIRAMEASGVWDEDAPLVAPGVSVPVAVIGTLCLLAGAVLVVLAIVGGGA